MQGNKETKKIPVIDLFAGPGGLGEGFSILKNDEGKSIFDIRLSIEKDVHAHKTLTWRSFYRQFDSDSRKVPKEYYKALESESLREREDIIEETLSQFQEGEIAKSEAQLVELGSKAWPKEKVDDLIDERLGDYHGPWVLIGGPPCQAYSNAGRSRVGGIDPKDHRVYLYKEYLRIIENHRPSIFVMENVEGLLSAKVDGNSVFELIKKDLSLDGEYSIYSFVKEVENNSDYLIKSENYGVPQARHRVILLGLETGLKHNGKYLGRSLEVDTKSVIGDIKPIRSVMGRSFVSYDSTKKYKNGKPRRIYQASDDSDENWYQLMQSQINKIKEWGDIPLNSLKNGPSRIKGNGSEFVKMSKTIGQNHPLKHWYLDERLNGIPNHQSRSHLTQDLMRYMFATLYVEKNKTFPRIGDFAKHNEELIPDHENALSGKFADRFRVQLGNRPASTITSHISKDGHYYIHYDPKQCRSLTVREAARLQTFPDNYLFRGSRTQQYHQVGNAVPPYLAYQLAKQVFNILKFNSHEVQKKYSRSQKNVGVS